MEISDPLYTEDDFIFSGNASVSGTDAGSYNMELKAEDFSNTNDNFANVTFEIVDGSLVIKPIDVTVTITEHGGEVDYDGEPHTVEGYDVEISDPLYTEADFTFGGTAEVSGTDAGSYAMELKAEYFTNTNGNFANVTFEIVDGSLVIKPIDVLVTIVGANNTADYDGGEHTVSGYSVSIDDPLYTGADFTFSGTAEAKRTDAGTAVMGLTADQFANANANFRNVTFAVTDGYQTINPIDVTVTVTGRSVSADYDGSLHTVSGYDVSFSSPLYTGADFTFSGTAEAERTDAGTTAMELDASMFANTNGNFADVTFSVTDGGVTIRPITAQVTITGRVSTVNYDGGEHTVTGYTVRTGTALYTEADFTFSGTARASRTEAGTTGMGLRADQFENVNPNFSRVTFTVTDGRQTVAAIPVTVTIDGNVASDTYNGQVHTVTGYRVSISEPLYTEADFAFSGEASAARTDAGTTYMGLAAEQFTNLNGSFGPVTFVVTDGQQTVAPIDAVEVLIEGAHGTVPFDGREHSVSGYVLTVNDQPLYNASYVAFTGAAEAKRTDVGVTHMGLAAEQFVNTNPNFSGVTFTLVQDGYQAVAAPAVIVTVTGRTAGAVYDGAEHSVSGYDVSISNPLYTEADFAFSGEASAARTDAGTTYMGLAAAQFTNLNPNFAGAVTFDVTDGRQEITPAAATVTVTGHRGSANYDGAEHGVEGYDVSISNPLYTEADFSFTGEAAAARTDAGKTPMGLAGSQFTNLNRNFEDVVFHVTDGYQEILPIRVVVTVTGRIGSSRYDGTEHKASGYDISFSTPLYRESFVRFTGTAEAARTDAGTTQMGLSAEQFANLNGNFTGVTFRVTDGRQTITPAPVRLTVTGAAGSDPYDGEEHRAAGYTAVSDNSLFSVENDLVFTGDATAKRTEVGVTAMGLSEDDFSTGSANFELVEVALTDGYEKVEATGVTVTITGGTATADYDGREHTAAGYSVRISDPLYTEDDFTFAGTDSVTRTDAGSYPMGLKEKDFTNNNPNFSVTFEIVDGSLTIKPIDVTVTVTEHSDEVDYDGKAHTVEGYDVAIGSPL